MRTRKGRGPLSRNSSQNRTRCLTPLQRSGAIAPQRKFGGLLERVAIDRSTGVPPVGTRTAPQARRPCYVRLQTALTCRQTLENLLEIGPAPKGIQVGIAFEARAIPIATVACLHQQGDGLLGVL